ncbi:putative ubiquitin carboxyl-terminal hydrolase 35 [Candidatus Erwinia dacicola]|nr:putative ubiquitin carboxyl-terminal hydrolase 35 [Candidatus Erwinia dacicola]
MDIADTVVEESAAVSKARLQVDTRKWILSRMAPKKYGDKITNEIVGKDGGAIQIETSPMSTLFGK